MLVDVQLGQLMPRFLVADEPVCTQYEYEKKEKKDKRKNTEM